VDNLKQERNLLEDMIHKAGDRKRWPPGIVRLLGHTLDGEHPFLVYEWVDGGDLAARVTRFRAQSGHGLPPETVIQVLRNIAEPLAAMHAWGLVHQDLKPANCLLPEEGSWELKLTDFGIGALVDPPDRMTAAQQTRTEQRQMRGSGTPLYMSFEQKHGEHHASNDVYSLGVIGYQLLLGDVSRELPPYWKEELTEDFTIPVPLVDVIGRCLSRRHDKSGCGSARLENAGLLLKLLDDLAPPRWTNSLGMEFVRIAAGTFKMGSPQDDEGRSDDESQHRVNLTKPFHMATTPVTQAQWAALMGSNPSHFKGDDLPVEQVSWDDATLFCEKLSRTEGKKYRLPTEAEWEYACRAGTQGDYGGTGSFDQVGWHWANSNKQTQPVGQKKPNAWGLFDMHGNVHEFCSDRYGRYPRQDLIEDPIGDSTNSLRVMRGGSWEYLPDGCRAAYRGSILPDKQDFSVGFRVCLEA
jgi:formylglycine-generating enzyme required for sulfatase activity